MKRKRMTSGLAIMLLFVVAQAATAQESRETEREPARRTAEADTHTGKFVAAAEGEFSMTAGDQQHSHQITTETKVAIDGQPAQWDDLRRGDAIRVTLGPQNTALAVEAFRQRRPGEERRRGEAREQRRYRTERRQDREGKPWLGVMLGQVREEGALITRTHPAGPAARGGLRSGDVLIRVEDTPVSTPDEAVRTIERLEAGQEANFVVLRNGEEVAVKVTLGDRDRFQRRGAEERFFRPDGDSLPPGVGPHEMMLEQHRRFAEQHERIENMVRELQVEIRSLREEVRALKDDQ